MGNIASDPPGTATNLARQHLAAFDHADIAELKALETAVVITHKGGTKTGYAPAADTDVARGTALIAAVAAAVSGDVIQLTANTYDLGSAMLALPAGVSLVGAGKAQTVVKSLVTCGTDGLPADLGPVILPGSGSLIKDMKVWGTADWSDGNKIVAAVGVIYRSTGIQNTVPTSFTVENCELRGESDAFLVVNQGTDPCAIRLNNVDMYGLGDTCCFYGKSGSVHVMTVDAFNCSFNNQGNEGNGQGFKISTDAYVTARLQGCVISSGLTATDGTDGSGKVAYTSSLHVGSANATVYCSGCTILSDTHLDDFAGIVPAWDIYMSVLGSIILDGCVYDPSKVFVDEGNLVLASQQQPIVIDLSTNPGTVSSNTAADNTYVTVGNPGFDVGPGILRGFLITWTAPTGTSGGDKTIAIGVGTTAAAAGATLAGTECDVMIESSAFTAAAGVHGDVALDNSATYFAADGFGKYLAAPTTLYLNVLGKSTDATANPGNISSVFTIHPIIDRFTGAVSVTPAE